MGKTERKNGELRIAGGVQVLLAVLIVLILAAAVYIFPRYGKVYAGYSKERQTYSAANDKLKAAQKTHDELTETLTELETAKSEVDAASGEVFTLAAKLEKDILAGKSDKKICYITLDDGPYNRGKEYLELFNKYDIKATFFLTTANGNKLPDQGDLTAASAYPEYLRYGHTIGNHTYSHNYAKGGIYTSPDAFMESVEKQQKFTEEATGGYSPSIVRFPGGTSMTGNDLEKYEAALREKGYGWIDWTIDSGDSAGGDNDDPAKIKKRVLKAAKEQKVMVVLFHEWSKNTLEVLPDIIEQMEKDGYIFLPLFKESAMVNK